MKKLFSKLLWKLGRKLVTWSARLEGNVMPQTVYPDPYTYVVKFEMEDGSIITKEGLVTLEKN